MIRLFVRLVFCLFVVLGLNTCKPRLNSNLSADSGEAKASFESEDREEAKVPEGDQDDRKKAPAKKLVGAK